jgi:hypothetical protein
VSNSDLATLRAKFPFLRDFSNEFIRANKPESLIKLETANVKLKEAERAKDADDRLAHNRTNIGTICVDMGIDDRGRPTCTTVDSYQAPTAQPQNFG